MKFFIPLILFFFLSSCSYQGEIEVTLTFPEEHFWEYYSEKEMWHTLSVYDGSTIKRYTISAEERSFRVKVNRGSVCIFTLYPLDYLSAKGGWYIPGEEKKILLKEEYGRFCDILLDVVEYNNKVLSALNPKTLFTSIDKDFDSDTLFYFFTEGSVNVSDIKKAKEKKIVIDEVPSGLYYSEKGECVSVKEDGIFTSNVIAGIHRYMNFDSKLTCVIALYSDGDSEYRIMASDNW